jgi:hypothetical protein
LSITQSLGEKDVVQVAQIIMAGSKVTLP